MSAFADLVPVQSTPPDVLANLARATWPVATIDGAQKFIDPRDLVTQAFTWGKEPIADAPGLVEIGRVRTFHSFGAPVFFKPTAAEVLLQIRHPIEQLRAEGKAVVAYEVVFDGHPQTSFHVLEGLSTAAYPKVARFDRDIETVHKAQVVLYSGEVPPDVRNREIIVAGKTFNAPAMAPA